ncbi:MAG TPA: hypothetical protein VGR21_01050, partial [Cryptosporangiaceae bacterium]|nr:hypothetical protein [Cryptosporangiaceae bacterium]
GAFAVAAPKGTQTFGGLLAECRRVTGSDARFTWVDDQRLLAAGVEPWTDLPLWLPREVARTAWDVEVGPALGTGLAIRPLAETVADSWAWMLGHADPPSRPGLPRSGLDPGRERAILVGEAPGDRSP